MYGLVGVLVGHVCGESRRRPAWLWDRVVPHPLFPSRIRNGWFGLKGHPLVLAVPVALVPRLCPGINQHPLFVGSGRCVWRDRVGGVGPGSGSSCRCGRSVCVRWMGC
jgi:hypothetical protein